MADREHGRSLDSLVGEIMKTGSTTKAVYISVRFNILSDGITSFIGFSLI